VATAVKSSNLHPAAGHVDDERMPAGGSGTDRRNGRGGGRSAPLVEGKPTSTRPLGRGRDDGVDRNWDPPAVVQPSTSITPAVGPDGTALERVGFRR
jgi:hypothetical protein